MSFKYKFTVFTPCYNSEKTLHRVFNSLMSQTIDHSIFEWLVINDASTDNTHNLIEKYIQKADFDIHYINLEKNQMLIKNYRLAIEQARGELFLAIGHDDAFVSETLEVFDSTWNSFSVEEREKCGSIGVLCQDQTGNKIGNDYPLENAFVNNIKAVFGWSHLGLGETWAITKTIILKKYFLLPSKIDTIKYIPESYFWNKIALQTDSPMSYIMNCRLRIYYINDNEDHISHNIKSKYSEGFEHESLYFINNYFSLFYKVPSLYCKHLVKYVMFSNWNKKSFSRSIRQIKRFDVKILFFVFYIPSLILKGKYFGN